MVSGDPDRKLPTLAEHAAANPVATGFAEEFRAGAVMAAVVTDPPTLSPAQIDAILYRLFTNGQGERASRLVLAQDLTKPINGRTYHDLGGWGREAVRRILEETPRLGLFPRPAVGEKVLAWLTDSWEIATYNGPSRGDYAWDFDTWGLADDRVERWLPLPPAPGEEP